MKIAISGSTGMVGSSLTAFATGGGHEVVRLVRRASASTSEITWDPHTGQLDAAAFDGVDAVVHLAGENIASGRWTTAQKQRIRASRSDGTRQIAEALARGDRKPRALVSASAIGFYGDRGNERLDESSPRGSGFLSDVCADWEGATEAASAAGIRVVHLRFGVILSPAGGALHKMLTPFKLGLGGPIGDGQQIMSWIALDDVVGAIHHAILRDDLSGPVNVVAPGAVSNAAFSKTLGKVLSRPAFMPLPAFAARLVMGEMADELLLSSANVVPDKLQQTGYPFRFVDLEPALRHLLGRTG